MKNVYKSIRYVIAGIFVLIGFIGLLIPVFPTVPFLIIAALVMGKKPSDIIAFYKKMVIKVKYYCNKIVRRFRKKKSDNCGK